MNKKRIALLVTAAVTFGAAACTKELVPLYKDGTYTAIESEFDPDSGWKDYVEITVSNGRISDVNWDSVNETGATKKELSEAGVYDMMAAGAKSQWHEQALSMESALVKEQDPAKIKVKDNGEPDAVSGVTIKVNGFLLLAQEALDEAEL